LLAEFAASHVRLAEQIVQSLNAAAQEPVRTQVTDEMKVDERDVVQEQTWWTYPARAPLDRLTMRCLSFCYFLLLFGASPTKRRVVTRIRADRDAKRDAGAIPAASIFCVVTRLIITPYIYNGRG
jgi:hypothetical protein